MELSEKKSINTSCINRFTSLRKTCASFSMLDGPCSAKNSVLNKFLHSEVHLLIQHIIVQDRDGQNIIINTRNWVDSAQSRSDWKVGVNAALNLWVL